MTAVDTRFTTTMPIEVEAGDISAIGFIDAVSYLRWVQDVVILHWRRFAPPAAQFSTLWIAVRHVVEYRSVGRRGDSISAKATIKRLKGVRAVFTTDIVNGERCLAHIESTWISLNAATRQPKILEQDVIRMFTDR